MLRTVSAYFRLYPLKPFLYFYFIYTAMSTITKLCMTGGSLNRERN